MQEDLANRRSIGGEGQTTWGSGVRGGGMHGDRCINQVVRLTSLSRVPGQLIGQFHSTRAKLAGGATELKLRPWVHSMCGWRAMLFGGGSQFGRLVCGAARREHVAFRGRDRPPLWTVRLQDASRRLAVRSSRAMVPSSAEE